MLRSNSKSLGNHVVSPEEEKEKAVVGKDLQKRKVLVLATLHSESCSYKHPATFYDSFFVISLSDCCQVT